MSRLIDKAKAAAESAKKEPGRQRPRGPLETTARDQAIAHGDAAGPGKGETPGLDKSAWPSKQGPGRSSL